MAEDWFVDVRKYVPDADEGVVRAIVRYCGIALQKRDSSLVSFSDPKETGRVRENFLKKKLGLTNSDEALDAAIAGVGERMKADRTKNRVTVYYLLAEHFGLLGLFGSSGASAGAGTAAAGAAAGLAAGATAAGIGGTSPTPVPVSTAGDNGAVTPPTPPVTAPPEPAAVTPSDSDVAGLTGAAAIAAGGIAGASYAGSGATADTVATPARLTDVPDDDGGSGMGKWLIWLLLAALAIALIFGVRSWMNKPVALPANSSNSTVATDTSGAMDTNEASGAVADGNVVAPPPADAAVPVGAGLVAGSRNGAPMLTVYFDTGKATVADEFGAAAVTLKDYVAAHPGAKLAVSGFNDPTGNAAVNAELSKNRAKAVSTALGAAGIAADSVVLEKPADTTAKAASNAEARRVEVTVKQ